MPIPFAMIGCSVWSYTADFLGTCCNWHIVTDIGHGEECALDGGKHVPNSVRIKVYAA